MLQLYRPQSSSRSCSGTDPPYNEMVRWRDGQMALRWCAAGMNEAARQFRRVNGYLHLPALRAALNNTVTPAAYHQQAA